MIKTKISVSKKELIYLIGFFLMSFAEIVISNSYLMGENRYDIANIVRYIAVLAFAFSFCIGKSKLKDLFIRVLLVLLIMLITISTHNLSLGTSAIAMITSLNIDLKRIIRFSVKCNLFFLLLVMIPSLLGVIPNVTYVHGNQIAYCLGFMYYSNVPYTVFGMLLSLYWLACSRRQENAIILSSIPIQLIIYKICTARLVLFMYLIFIILVLLFRLLDKNKKHKVLSMLVMVLYPFAAIFNFVISIFYYKYDILIKLNDILNYRLAFNARAFTLYKVNLFGQKIVTSGERIDSNYVNHYFFVDSGFVFALLSYGIIFFVLLLLMYCVISRQAMKNKDFKLVSWCIIVCLFSIINNNLFSISTNQLPLIAFAVLLDSKVLKRYSRYIKAG